MDICSNSFGDNEQDRKIKEVYPKGNQAVSERKSISESAANMTNQVI